MKRWKVTYYLGIVIAVLAVAGIMVYLFLSWNQKRELEQLRQDAIINNTAEVNPIGSDETVPYPGDPIESIVIDRITGESEVIYVDPGLTCPVDFYGLWNECPDIYAWIRIPGMIIDYPVLQHAGSNDTYEESNYYLRRDLNGNYSTAGNLYSQHYYNRNFDVDNITVVYGHKMRDLQMFGTLDQYMDEDFCEAHKFIYFYTSYHSYRYRVVAVLTRTSDNIMYQYGGRYADQGDYSDFVEDFNNGTFGNGWVDEDFSAGPDDHFLILSTCNGDYSQRTVVVAVREEAA